MAVQHETVDELHDGQNAAADVEAPDEYADSKPPPAWQSLTERRGGKCAAALLRMVWNPSLGNEPGIAATVLFLAVQINLLLAFFNLIPVPPLDGGNVMLGLLPPGLAAIYSQLRQYGFIILYALMLTGAASAFISPPTNFMMRLLIP